MKKPLKRILYIANGNSIHIKRITSYFASNNYEVHLVTCYVKHNLDPRVIVHQAGYPFMSKFLLSRCFEYFLILLTTYIVFRQTKPDIVDAHYITTYGLIAVLSKCRPLIVTAWGSDLLLKSKRNLLSYFISNYVLKKATAIIALFPKATVPNEIICRIRCNIFYIPLGVDTRVFKQHPRGYFRSKHSIHDNCPIVIYTRGIKPLYDPNTYLKAIPLVLEIIPQTRFILVTKHSRDVRLKKLIEQLEIGNALLIVKWMPRSLLAYYYSDCDIYVSASLSDGASNSLLEAMSCQLPPIVTNIPANRFWIKEGFNGLLFTPGNYKSLAENIIFLINNRNLASSYGKKSREVIKRNIEESNQMKKIEAVYIQTMKHYY
jgi:glycosyltransferase involved in cell wall biosynthesis